MASNREVLEKLESWFFDDSSGIENFVEDFAKAHKDVFDMDKEEHKLEYMDVYKDFQRQFETKIEGFLKDNGFTSEDLVEAVKEEQKVHGDSAGTDVIGVILATLEYDIFCQMMAEAKERFA